MYGSDIGHCVKSSRSVSPEIVMKLQLPTDKQITSKGWKKLWEFELDMVCNQTFKERLAVISFTGQDLEFHTIINLWCYLGILSNSSSTIVSKQEIIR